MSTFAARKFILRSGVSTALLLGAACPTNAQEALELDPIVVEAESGSVQQSGGEKGAAIATSSNTATKLEAPIVETPRSVSVVTEQRLEDQGVQDVDDALLYVPGVYSAAYGRDTRGDYSFIRGIAPLQLVNGLRSNFGFYNNPRINPFTLQSVDVIKGPASVLYGANATGGVVNLISKRPEPVRNNEVFVEYGSFNRKQLGFDLTGPIDSAATMQYRVIGIGRDSGTQVNHVDDDSLVLAPSFAWQPTNDTRLTVLGNFQRDDGQATSRYVPIQGSLLPTPSGHFIGTHQFFGEPGFDKYIPEGVAVTSILEHRINEIFSIDARARYSVSSTAYDHIWPAFGVPYEADGRSRRRTLYSARNNARSFVSDARLGADFATGFVRHQAVAGFDYQNATLDSDVGYAALPPIDLITPVYGARIPAFARINNPKQDIEQLGFYVIDRMSINDKLFISLGARHDTYSQTTRDSSLLATEAGKFSGSAGLLYKFDTGIAPYVSYTTSFDPLAPDSFGFRYAPSEGEQIEAGVKYQIPGIPTLLTASVFNLNQKNRQVNNPNYGPGKPVYVQTGEAAIQGVEFDIQTAIYDFELLASYTHLETEDKATGFALASVPENQASAWLTYRPRHAALRGFVVGTGVRYVGESFDGRNNHVIPSYTLFDAQIGYETEHYSAKLNIQNIADEIYLTSCLGRGDCYYGERRTISLRLSRKL
ncbi:MAG TPA: TonB-dependent siderophore receptor [Azospirillaceae bacterium]|nr:TonB-dependent siderophore receptor [Azospirillaceae bacterium]